MSETIKLATMHVRHTCCDRFDEVREAFADQALKARDEFDTTKAEITRLRAELVQIKAENESGAMAYEDLVKALADRNGEVERLRTENALVNDQEKRTAAAAADCLKRLERCHDEADKYQTRALKAEAENAELRQKDSEAAGTLRANIAEIQLVETMRELEWFRRREPWVEEAMEGSIRELINFVIENPKPGAGA